MSEDLSRSGARGVFEKIVSIHILPTVTKAGFERAGSGQFRRVQDDSVHRIAATFRKVPRRDEGWLTVTVCVGFRSLAGFLKDFPVVQVKSPRFPCTMATDLGHLQPPFKYKEWRLLPETDSLMVGADVAGNITAFGFPFFESFGDLRKAVAAWEKGTSYNLGESSDYYLAASYWLRGEIDKAMAFARDRIDYYRALRQEKERNEDRNLLWDREAFLKFLARKKIRE